MDKFKNKYRIQSARLNGWDYGSSGIYFVTICTKHKQQCFGEIQNNVETQNIASLHCAFLRETEIGNIAHQHWLEIPNHFPFEELDAFVIMPNHVHGILVIDRPEYNDWTPNRFIPQSRNLPSIIRGYKASVKKYAMTHNILFAWQPRYFDKIVWDETMLKRIRQYIANNPIQWFTDKAEAENISIK
ncbi:MAG: hypothetical protein WCW40_10805 [Bacteroidota bacterium]